MSVKIYHSDYPERSVALTTPDHTLVFHHSASNAHGTTTTASSLSLDRGTARSRQQCAVEFAATENMNLQDYTPLSRRPCLGCLGLITIARDIFLCVITQAKEVARVRPEDTVYRILEVEFHCLNRTDYDFFFESEVNGYPTEEQPIGLEHPCLALKKLISDGTFYYSGDFDLTSRLQDRSVNLDNFDIEAFDSGFMWNSHMIDPLLEFRSHLSDEIKSKLDQTRFLTCVIRGFVESMTIQRPSPRTDTRARAPAGLPAMLTLISRLSCRRAGTRFNARGIDDDGNVANFVETETVIWNPGAGPSSNPVGFSYCQIRGSIPIFWEQQTGLLPNQQKIQITRSPEATQPAFDKHMESLVLKYGAAHIVNLLSEIKPGEVELSQRYQKHIRHSSLLVDDGNPEIRTKASLLRSTEYDFHAETKGPMGYEAASQIKHIVTDSAEAFGYFLIEGSPKDDGKQKESFLVVLQQDGVFRTNCLDCLDRTNLVQGILSKMAIESHLEQREEIVGNDFWMRHSTLWADNGDALSKIYAGTGALKSSFTRTGKMSLAGAFADARKSATRMYINNFADKDRQNTIDVLLGRLVGQEPVGLYDPTNDYVTAELSKRLSEFTTELPIHIFCGTFNLNGKTAGLEEDLMAWLRPSILENPEQHPELVVIGFQEIVELSPQQIMATEPTRRKLWEKALLKCLNHQNDDPYILLRGGQLVGAALLIFVKSSAIGQVKNAEGSLKKTGMSGVAGNKGAVAIRLEYANTRLCFVTAHLAAGFSNIDERNRDYATISNGLRFQRGRKIEDHDSVIWLGDFNYRIGLPDDKVRKLIEVGDFQDLYDNDQLHLQMMQGKTFPFYNEARLTFNPTYKYDIGTDVYDSSEKSRIPAWCDRVLWKGEALDQLSYGCADIRFSDHRPVFATFRCTVSVVNDVIKSKLSRELYIKYESVITSKHPNSILDADDEEELLDMEPLAPGLAAPSSEKQKWWLADGLPAKSTIRAPSSSTLNPQRPPNPFVETSEPDWVQIDFNAQPKPLGRSSTFASPNSYTRQLVARKLPPPYNPSALPPLTPRPTPPAPGANKHVPQRPPSPAHSSSSSSSTILKPKPPVPQKPAELSANRRSLDGMHHHHTNGSDGVYHSHQSDGAGVYHANVQSTSFKDAPKPIRELLPPPPKRATTMGLQSARPLVRKPVPAPAPALPPRSEDLMDGGVASGMERWEALKPSGNV